MKKSILTNIIIVASIVIIVNLISLTLFHRFDLSKNKMYSLSETSKNTIKSLEDRLVVKAYFSENLPPQYADARRYTKDLLSEYAVYSKGNLKFEFIDPATEDDLKKEAQKNMIQPVQMQINENDKMEIRDVYLGLAFLYQGKSEVIPLVQNTQGLEYDITLAVKKLISGDQKKIAVFKPEEISQDMFGRAHDNYSTLNQIISENYQIVDTDLMEPIADDISGLIVTGVKDSLYIEQLYNIDQYIMNGGSVAFFQDRVQASIQTQQAQVIPTNLFDLLSYYGIKIKQNLVGDANCGQVNLSRRQGMFSMQTPVKYPFIPIISNFNSDSELVGNIDILSLIFASELDDNNLPEEINFEPLIFTSDNSIRVNAPRFDIGVQNYMNKDLTSILTEEPAILGGLYQGTFNSRFAGDPDFPDTKTESIPTKIIFIADGDILLDDRGAGNQTNMEFVLNTLDTIAGDSSLIQLRSRGTEYRPLKSNISNQKKKMIKWTNILLPSILLVLYGLFSFKLYKNKKKMVERIYE